MENIGKNIQRFRGASGLTQHELAEKADISLRGIQDIERGIILSPRHSTLHKIASVLGLTVDQLVSGDDTPPINPTDKSELLTRLYSGLPTLNENQLSTVLKLVERFIAGDSVSPSDSTRDLTHKIK